MENREFGRWIHPAFAATSMAFLLTMLDKQALTAGSYPLIFANYFYVVSVIINSIYAYLYFLVENPERVAAKIRGNLILKGFENLSFWSFVFATCAVLLYVIQTTSQSLQTYCEALIT